MVFQLLAKTWNMNTGIWQHGNAFFALQCAHRVSKHEIVQNVDQAFFFTVPMNGVVITFLNKFI